MKSCAQHSKYFPEENRFRDESEFGKYSLSKDHLQPKCKRCEVKANSISNPVHGPASNPIRNGEVYSEQYDFRQEFGGLLSDAKKAWTEKTGRPWLTPKQIMAIVQPGTVIDVVETPKLKKMWVAATGEA